MDDPLILVLDAGTTSTRALVFDANGTVIASAAHSITQHYPASGRVEQDAEEIWRLTRDAAARAIDAAGGPHRIAGIGIANQRETILFWDRTTGAPLAPAIVWQDRRTAALCRRLIDAGEEPGVQARTGLLLDPYFSATKIAWAMANWPAVAEAGERLAIGTVESWLVWQLTGGAHVTDATNASRTLLMGLGSGAWDDGLIDLFGVPRRALPTIIDSAGRCGETRLFGPPIPICGLAGDQQAAAIGQACLSPGETKATFGTGAFILTHSGATPPVSRHRLLSTVAWQLDGRRTYALEGSIFVAGSLIQWLRDQMGLIEASAETAGLAASVPDTGGVYCVPALSGLGAPWWRPEARGAMTGLSFATGRAHLVRAALEAMAYQAHDLKRAFAADHADWATIRIDGGMASNDWMAQDLADILAVPVERPDMVETTALGAAMLAAVGAGIHPDLPGATKAMRGVGRSFAPELDEARRGERLAGWRAAVAAVLGDA
jgi:glycerol kinase